MKVGTRVTVYTADGREAYRGTVQGSRRETGRPGDLPDVTRITVRDDELEEDREVVRTLVRRI